jgi:hypothetical protein
MSATVSSTFSRCFSRLAAGLAASLALGAVRAHAALTPFPADFRSSQVAEHLRRTPNSRSRRSGTSCRCRRAALAGDSGA